MNKRSIFGKSITIAAVLFLAVGASVPAQAGGHYGHHYGHGGHHHDDSGAYLAGGLILGSLLTHAYMSRPEPHYEDRTVVVERPVVVRAAPGIGRRLLRDRDGSCFEKNYNDRGDEILVELDPVECDW